MERRYRLTRREDFGRVHRQGRAWSHPLLILSAVRNDLGCTRFGFVVSRRIGGAVVRNRVKRRLREAVRHHLSEFPVGWDVVLVARGRIAQARYADVESAVTRSLGRAQPWLSAHALAAS